MSGNGSGFVKCLEGKFGWGYLCIAFFGGENKFMGY